VTIADTLASQPGPTVPEKEIKIENPKALSTIAAVDTKINERTRTLGGAPKIRSIDSTKNKEATWVKRGSRQRNAIKEKDEKTKVSAPSKRIDLLSERRRIYLKQI
jgi:hypothetical protein